jgi:hypothetical protein
VRVCVCVCACVWRLPARRICSLARGIRRFEGRSAPRVSRGRLQGHRAVYRVTGPFTGLQGRLQGASYRAVYTSHRALVTGHCAKQRPACLAAQVQGRRGVVTYRAVVVWWALTEGWQGSGGGRFGPFPGAASLTLWRRPAGAAMLPDDSIIIRRFSWHPYRGDHFSWHPQ